MFRLVLVMTVSLGLFTPGRGREARADDKVDWNQYIEKPGDKRLVVSHAPAPATVSAKTPAAKTAKAKKPAAKAPTKKAARKKK